MAYGCQRRAGAAQPRSGSSTPAGAARRPEPAGRRGRRSVRPAQRLPQQRSGRASGGALPGGGLQGWAAGRESRPRCVSVRRGPAATGADGRCSWTGKRGDAQGRRVCVLTAVLRPSPNASPHPLHARGRCGELEFYDKVYDRITVKSNTSLEKTKRAFRNVTTSDDPVIRCAPCACWRGLRGLVGPRFRAGTALSSGARAVRWEVGESGAGGWRGEGTAGMFTTHSLPGLGHCPCLSPFAGGWRARARPRCSPPTRSSPRSCACGAPSTAGTCSSPRRTGRCVCARQASGVLCAGSGRLGTQPPTPTAGVCARRGAAWSEPPAVVVGSGRRLTWRCLLLLTRRA